MKRFVSGKDGSRGTPEFFRARFYRGAKIRSPLIFAPAGILLGSAFPKPCYAPCRARKEVTDHAKEIQYAHRRHVVKTRMTDEEYADFTGRLAAYEISQSEFIRQAIRKATIRPIVTVSPVNDGLLAALSKLTAEYGKIGGNLNQIARSLNEYGSPYRGLEKEVRGAAADLAALKFEVLQKVGEAVGDTQTYQL